MCRSGLQLLLSWRWVSDSVCNTPSTVRMCRTSAIRNLKALMWCMAQVPHSRVVSSISTDRCLRVPPTPIRSRWWQPRRVPIRFLLQVLLLEDRPISRKGWVYKLWHRVEVTAKTSSISNKADDVSVCRRRAHVRNQPRFRVRTSSWQLQRAEPKCMSKRRY